MSANAAVCTMGHFHLNAAHILILLSLLLLIIGSYAMLFSAFLPKTGIWVRVTVTY